MPIRDACSIECQTLQGLGLGQLTESVGRDGRVRNIEAAEPRYAEQVADAFVRNARAV